MLEAGIGCFNQKYLKAFKCVALVGPDRNAHIFQIILYFSRDLGKKMYELSNHLGNVLTTVSDIKLTADGNADGMVDSYAAVITSAQDYYPFGSLEPGRTYSSDNYRFGFNGKENPSECEKHQLKLKVIKLKNLFNLFYQDQALCFPTFYRQVDGAFN